MGRLLRPALAIASGLALLASVLGAAPSTASSTSTSPRIPILDFAGTTVLETSHPALTRLRLRHEAHLKLAWPDAFNDLRDLISAPSTSLVGILIRRYGQTDFQMIDAFRSQLDTKQGPHTGEIATDLVLFTDQGFVESPTVPLPPGIYDVAILTEVPTRFTLRFSDLKGKVTHRLTERAKASIKRADPIVNDPVLGSGVIAHTAQAALGDALSYSSTRFQGTSTGQDSVAVCLHDPTNTDSYPPDQVARDGCTWESKHFQSVFEGASGSSLLTTGGSTGSGIAQWGVWPLSKRSASNHRIELLGFGSISQWQFLNASISITGLPAFEDPDRVSTFGGKRARSLTTPRQRVQLDAQGTVRTVSG